MATDLDGVFTALSDPTRRGIIDLLRERPRRAGDIASRFDSASPTISRHLRVLRTSGLIEETADVADARARVYRLRSEPFADLGAWVDQVQAYWRDTLQDFADFVEAEQEKDSEK